MSRPSRTAAEESGGRVRATAGTLVAVCVGNALEWFDWGAYVAFAALLASPFFGQDDPGTALLRTLAVFAVGFFFRPLGGALIGAFGDLYGRRAGLTLSVLLMAGGSLLIALTPDAQRIGVLAPVLLVIARAAQGLSAGGEVSVMSTYVTESAPPGRRSLYASLIYVSTTLGTLAATLLLVALNSWLPDQALRSWGWRVPFGIGAALALYGWYLRRRVPETVVFDTARSRSGSRPEHPGTEQQSSGRPAAVHHDGAVQALVRLVRDHPRALAQVVGFTVGTTVVYYTFAVYLPTHAQVSRHVAAVPALWAAVVAQLVFVLCLPGIGLLVDRFGRRPALLVFGVGFTLLPAVLFALLGSSAVRLGVVMTAALLLFGLGATAAPPAMVEMFPTRLRATAIGLPYSLTVALFGGTAPYLVEYLTRHGAERLYPFYVAGLCLVSTLTFATYRQGEHADLTDDMLSYPHHEYEPPAERRNA